MILPLSNFVALNSEWCADVLLRNCSLTHSLPRWLVQAVFCHDLSIYIETNHLLKPYRFSTVHFSGPGRAAGPVCVCLLNWTKWCWTLDVCHAGSSWPKVKVIGRSLRSQYEKCCFSGYGCTLQGCKNRPDPLPDCMLYKMTKFGYSF